MHRVRSLARRYTDTSARSIAAMKRHRTTPWFPNLAARAITGLCVVAGLSGCLTGERPTLLVDGTIPPLADGAAAVVIDSLEIGPSTAFTVSYTVTTRYGGLVTDASISHDPMLGTSVNVSEVRYITRPDGSTLTCSTITGDCSPGIDETRVSNRQLTSSIFTISTAERMRQDLKVAVADSVGSNLVIASRDATCAAIPVVDANGLRRDKTYCSYTDLGVVASIDTADLLIEATGVIDSANQSLFSGS